MSSSTDCDRATHGIPAPPSTDADLAEPNAALSRPAGLIVAAAAAVCVTTAIVHMFLVFLYVAPPNVVSQRYQRQIDAWVYPYFEQNWQMFAPNPESAPQHIRARAATTSSSGARRAGRWLDLTAQDTAAVRHDPFPSHTAQNMLRRAWSLYSTVQGTGGQSDSERARMLQQYLTDIAAQRLAAHGSGAFDAVQLRVDTTPIGAPGSPSPRLPSSTRYLPWWQVSSHGH